MRSAWAAGLLLAPAPRNCERDAAWCRCDTPGMPPEVRDADAVAAFAGLVGATAAAAVTARAARRRFARGQPLMHAGQIPSDVFLLSSGVVKVSATTEAGRDVLLAFRGAGDLIG